MRDKFFTMRNCNDKILKKMMKNEKHSSMVLAITHNYPSQKDKYRSLDDI